jgi:hypothetical protein
MRYKVEFEIAVREDDLAGNLRHFSDKLDQLLGDNVPEQTGWAQSDRVKMERRNAAQDRNDG